VFRNRAQEGRKRRGWGGERRCLPVSLVVKHGIENNKEFAHAGDERGLGVLTIGTQPQIESSDGGIAANSRHRRHIQDAPDLCATAPDTTAAAQFPTIAVKRCQPGQCSDLLAIKHSQLRQLREQSTRENLADPEPETVLNWRRNGWSAIWRYRSRGHWRGGRLWVPSEVRQLITWIAPENFLWGAPRIHDELLVLGFNISQATVSRYLPAPGRRPTQSWRTFLRNQASAFGQYSEVRSRVYACLQGQSRWAKFMGSDAAPQVAAVGPRQSPTPLADSSPPEGSKN
jgi:hypothetical protein